MIKKIPRSYFSRLKPKSIYYRNEQKFLDDIKNTNFCFNTDDPNENYELITDLFSKIVSEHAPLKKIIEGQPGTFYK